MKFKKQIFGFMDMLRFKQLVPNRREALANGSNTPLPKTYRTNELAKRLHPGFMQVELVDIRPLTDRIKAFTFRRLDADAFPYFRAGQYVSLQTKIKDSLVSRPYSIASSPKEALSNTLVLGIEEAGLLSSYMHHEAAIGDHFVMSEPSGEFYYECIRDQKQVIAIAGGSGITPILSMAKVVAQQSEQYEMTLFYGARKEEQIAFREELEALKEQGIRVIYVLSDETKEGFEHSFVSAQLIEKYADIKQSTFFLCGPQSMYAFVLKELEPYQLPLKAIHKDASCCEDLAIDQPKTYQLTVHMRADTYVIDALENETLLVAMERAGLNAPNKCRAGGCGFCHSKWISGDYIVAQGRDGRREADKKFGFIHPCVTYPKADMEIEVPPAY